MGAVYAYCRVKSVQKKLQTKVAKLSEANHQERWVWGRRGGSYDAASQAIGKQVSSEVPHARTDCYVIIMS